MDRVAVPFWLVVLSDQLPVIALVSRYLANKLIGRRPLPDRESFTTLRFVKRNVQWTIDNEQLRKFLALSIFHCSLFIRFAKRSADHPVLAPLSRGYP